MQPREAGYNTAECFSKSMCFSKLAWPGELAAQDFIILDPQAQGRDSLDNLQVTHFSPCPYVMVALKDTPFHLN